MQTFPTTLRVLTWRCLFDAASWSSVKEKGSCATHWLLQAAKYEKQVIGFCDWQQKTVISDRRSYTFSRKSADYDRWPMDWHTFNTHTHIFYCQAEDWSLICLIITSLSLTHTLLYWSKVELKSIIACCSCRQIRALQHPMLLRLQSVSGTDTEWMYIMLSSHRKRNAWSQNYAVM